MEDREETGGSSTGSSGGRSWQNLLSVAACGVLLLVFIVVFLMLRPTSAQVGLRFGSANDLWGIHDLLLAGYSGVFMQPSSAGASEVQKAAQELARLLPALHPHAQCRESLAKLLGTSPGVPAMQAPSEELLLQAALETWTCLPARFSPSHFHDPFLPAYVGNPQDYKQAKMTEPLRYYWSGTCRDTGWPRTCSYWVSMHAMAARADELTLGQDLLAALVPILAGGATFCGGCTRHFRSLTQPVLSPAVREGLGQVF